MGLGTYLSDRMFGRSKEDEDKLRREREQLAASLYPKLLEQYTPEETAAITRRLVEGEGINLPTMRSRLLPPSPGVDVPSRSTLEPLKYIEPSTTVVDKATGEYKIVPGKNAKIYGNEPESEVPVQVYDEETGKLKTVGSAKKGSKVLVKPREGIDKEKAQRFQLFKEKGKLRDIMSAQGMDTSEIDAELESMASEHGYEYAEISKDPNWWQKLTGEEPKTVKTLRRTNAPEKTPVKSNDRAPYGETTKRNGKTYKWSDVDNKYHLVK